MNSECGLFISQKTCERGSKICRWDSAAVTPALKCQQVVDCADMPKAKCMLSKPKVYTIGTATKVCQLKADSSACEAGTLTEDTCVINMNFQYHWKDAACSLCAGSTPPGDGDGSNATVIAFGLLSILALIS